MKYKKINIGQKFNLLTVIDKLDKRKNNSIVWLCQCECGNYKEVTSADLNSNRVKSCGCLNSKIKQGNYEHLEGQRFGRLQVISITNKRTNSRGIIWHCKCDCGNECDVSGDRLKRGQQSCGCYQREKVRELGKSKGYDLTGQRFGKLTPLFLLNNTTERIWHCKCDCGNEVNVKSQYLLNHHTSSCGCGIRSLGENIIFNLLEESNIPFQTEYSFIDCIFPDTNYKARFDFYVNDQYIIEYDGEQHFQLDRGFWSNSMEKSSEILQKTQEHDRLKNEYCKKYNIPIIRIPYTHLSKITLEDLLIESSRFII